MKGAGEFLPHFIEPNKAFNADSLQRGICFANFTPRCKSLRRQAGSVLPVNLALGITIMNIRYLIFAASLIAAQPIFAADKWLQIYKSKSGFLFDGIAKTGKFSFDVPGDAIKTTEDNGRAFASIDNVVFQLFLFGSDSKLQTLAAHKKFEVDYLTSSGAMVTESSICKSLKLNHEEWRATAQNGAASYFVTIMLGNQILVVVAASDPELSSSATVKLAAACASFNA